MTGASRLTIFDGAAIAVAAVSACALLLELTWPHELAPPARSEEPAKPLEKEAHDVVPVGPLSDYLAISDRPLFTHDRRPFVIVAEAAPVAPAGPRAEFELTAVIITSATQIALLRSNLTPTVQRVMVTQTIDGWTLTEIAPESVVLTRGAEAVTVALRQEVRGSRSGQAANRETRRSRN